MTSLIGLTVLLSVLLLLLLLEAVAVALVVFVFSLLNWTVYVLLLCFFLCLFLANEPLCT